jgi:alpha-L-rhamnosidase
MPKINRREFLATSTAAGGSLLLAQTASADASGLAHEITETVSTRDLIGSKLRDLSPARWIWYPCGRTLPNTFILFRRSLQLAAKPRRATGWICADSRYKLEVNGQRVQWGPAPCDPRWAEADPLDLTGSLQVGENVLGATVLFYGSGDGTWPLGKPGFLFWLEIEHVDGRIEIVVSDVAWQTLLCRAWPPGHAKRWYLRALQEEFDASLYPYNWSRLGFETDSHWLPAMPLDGSPNKPSLSADSPEYTLQMTNGPADTGLRPRRIPMLQESIMPVVKLAETYWLNWSVTPRDYFDFRVPNAFKAEHADVAVETAPGQWRVELDGSRAAALTFELPEQVVGWPGFTIDAPAGTTVEVLVHEAHALGGPPLLNTHFDSWTRFICREGTNEFETFDFESLRWMQLHIHNAIGTVLISKMRVRRRVFPWPNQAKLYTSEPDLQRLFNASINTLDNCAQETLVDGMARERQQYSGDGGHQMHAVHLAHGEPRLVARYLTTWSQGLMKEGYFLDCWPAYDRLARVIEREMGLTSWGPILDHGVGFIFDCRHHYFYTGELEALREPYPRLLQFALYLQGRIGGDNLLPVENLGIPSVWMDHHAYQQQRHKQCAFNLYTAAAMQYALAPICRAFGNDDQAEALKQIGRKLVAATVRRFWSTERKIFICNLPWLIQDKSPRMCDRSLATAVLFDQCPDGQTDAAINSLAACPPEMGFSYPANQCWRMWALAKGGRVDVILTDLRRLWSTMPSVRENNTLQEDWHVTPDSANQWSHCGVVPLYIAYQGLMGLKPLEPGFKRYELRPQLGDLEDLDLTAFTTVGPLSMSSRVKSGGRELVFELPTGGQGELVLPQEASPELPELATRAPAGHRRYALPLGGTLTIHLKHV